jgi:hypothetical protein
MTSKAGTQRLSTAYAEIKRLDELAKAERRRVDGLFKSSEVAVNAALVAQEKAVAAALAASEKAVNKAEIAQANVNENQNEFRGTLRDQALTLMPRAEAENLIRELRGLITAQAEVIAGLRSRLDIGPPSLATLQTRSDEQTGANARGQQDWARIVAAAGILFAGIGVAAKLLGLV